MDFGIARLISGPETAPQTSAVMGTASYLSPEQAQGQSVDARTDIYSLGVVLYELLTGRPPFTGDSPMAIAYKQVNATPPAPSSANPEVPPELDAVVMRALSKNPANRYQTAQEFADDLERARTGQEVRATPLLPAGGEATQVISRPQPTSVLPPHEDRPGSSRKAWVGALLAILVMALLAAGAYLIVTMLTDGDGTELVVVPNVEGLPRARAERELENAKLAVGDVTKRRTDRVEPGIVLEQNPAADRKVDEGSAVNLVISAAPRLIDVPSVIGLDVDQATQVLEGAGLTLGEQTRQNSQTVPEGGIISQDPGPGAKAEPGSAVNVTVSEGRSLVIVPDVTCKSLGAAQTQLEGLGLDWRVGGDVVPLAECPDPDLVAEQDTEPGSAVPPGTVIVLHQGIEAPSPSPSPSPSP
jgi:beta-lactam-binding protein with PASTA domain